MWEYCNRFACLHRDKSTQATQSLANAAYNELVKGAQSDAEISERVKGAMKDMKTKLNARMAGFFKGVEKLKERNAVSSALYSRTCVSFARFDARTFSA